MDKEDMVHLHNGILFSHKKDEIMPFAVTWMHLEMITLNEVNQTEKDKYHMILLIYGILRKRYKWTYLQNKQSHRLGEPPYGYQSISEGDRLEVWDWNIHTAIFKIDSQQGPIV